MQTVLFHRNFSRFQGGHLKVFHYFEHVRSSPTYRARIRFTADSVWDAGNPWWNLQETVVGPEERVRADVLFLAGMDWRALDPAARGDSPVPIINLIQGFRHTRREDPAFPFLAHRAVRICVSEPLAQELAGVDTVAGPIFTVPIGLDLESLPAARAQDERDIDCVVLAIKDRPLGRSVAERLRSARVRVALVDRPLPRAELLELLSRARVSVHVPAHVEGAYLPALESMALDTPVVCPDCVGNRSFCRDGDTCLVPERSERALSAAACELLSASDEARERMLLAGRRESARHTLAAERQGFLEILERVPALWPQR